MTGLAENIEHAVGGILAARSYLVLIGTNREGTTYDGKTSYHHIDSWMSALAVTLKLDILNPNIVVKIGIAAFVSHFSADSEFVHP